MMRTSEEEAAKNSILMYEKDAIEDVESLIAEVRDLCQCEIEHVNNSRPDLALQKWESHISQ